MLHNDVMANAINRRDLFLLLFLIIPSCIAKRSVVDSTSATIMNWLITCVSKITIAKLYV